MNKPTREQTIRVAAKLNISPMKLARTALSKGKQYGRRLIIDAANGSVATFEYLQQALTDGDTWAVSRKSKNLSVFH